jgi:hypothetical protein
MKNEMMQANKDNTIEIKVIDRYCYHVKLERRSVKPGNEQYPEVSHQIKAFPVKTFEKMEALRNGPHKIIWYKAGGFVSATVVHDPTLEPEEEEILEGVSSPDPVKSELRKAEKRIKAKVAKAVNAAKESAASDK